jgi:hypothetical protein
MSRNSLGPSLALALLLSGCVTSFEPFVTDENALFDAELVGVWNQTNGKSTWEFQADDGDYRVIVSEADGSSGVFRGRLTELDGRRFLDLAPSSDPIDASDFYQWHLLPLHSFAQVETTDSGRRLALMNLDWLRKHLREHPDAIAVQTVNHREILSASTSELRDFVAAHAAEPEFFRDPIELERAD